MIMQRRVLKVSKIHHTMKLVEHRVGNFQHVDPVEHDLAVSAFVAFRSVQPLAALLRAPLIVKP
jgi:hypothetical protein